MKKNLDFTDINQVNCISKVGKYALAGFNLIKISQINLKTFKIYNNFVIKSTAVNMSGMNSIVDAGNNQICIYFNYCGVNLLKYE